MSQWEYWAARLEPRLVFSNCGIYGQRTDEIMARLDDCARGADMLLVQGGINDIAQGRSVDAAAQHLRTMVRRGKELELRVAIIDVLPWNNGWPEAEPKIRRLNALIAELARDESVPLLPFHDTLEDPDRPGRMRAEWTSDGDHPSVEGYRKLGEVVARVAPT
jgi:lysophospholipase L1-like esterase